MNKNIAIILGAGKGSRMKLGYNKQFLELRNEPIIIRNIRAFENHCEIDEIYVVSSKDEINKFKKLIEKYDFKKVRGIIEGGKERSDSVLNGLRGIDAVRDNIIRPLIDIDRSAIERFCEEMNIETRLDATNLENIYSRNKIRLDVLPYISENFNKDIVRTIMRTIDSFTIDNDYLEEQGYIEYKRYTKNLGDKIVIDKNAFVFHKAVLSRIIRNVMKELLGNIKEIEKKHIDDIILIQSGETGKELILPRKIKVTNNYGDIVIQVHNKTNEFIDFEKDINLSGSTYIEELDITIECEVTDKKNINKFSNNYLIKYFDYDKIKKVTIRNRRDGDFFTPLGMKGRKKLKDLFINEKIDKNKRNKIPLILFDNEIAWIVGLRISEKFKITEETKRILIIQVKRGNCSE